MSSPRRKLKLVADVEMGQSPSSSDCTAEGPGLPFLQGNAEFGEEHPEPKLYCEMPPKRCASGDILLSVRAPVGAINVADQVYGLGRGLCALRARANVIDPDYLRYGLLASIPLLQGGATGSTYDAVALHDVSQLTVPYLSSPREQRAIADYLDHETEKIDTLVAKKQRLVEVLQEKRAALVTRSVTKGLDPDAPMKDSGSVFLPEMPAHWDSLHLGHLCRKISDGPHYSPEYVEDGILFLSTRNIGVDGWHLEDAKRISADDFALFCRKVVPKPDDVLYTKGGTTGIARAVDIDEPFQVWVHVAVLKLREEIVNPFFLAYALNSAPCYGQSQLYTRGATNNDLGLTRMTRIKLGLPPMREQFAIVRHLNLETARIDALVASIKNASDRRDEYRSALITAAVTGQIDVREYAKRAN